MTLQPGQGQGIGKAPLLFVFAPVFLSLVLSAEGLGPLTAGSVAFLACLGGIFLFSGARPPRFLSFSLLIALTASVFSILSVYRIQAFELPPGTMSDEGEVILERPWGAKRAVIVEGKTGRFLLKVPPDQTVPEGQCISFTGEPASFRESPGSSFREGLYWRARGVTAEIVPVKTGLKRVQLPGLPSFRTALRKKILLGLPPATRGYLLAALLGASDPALAADHRSWGTSHLLAVSGFHVGLAAAAAWKLFSLAFFRRRLSMRGRAALVSGFVWAYALIAGGAPSAIRAALMIQSVLLGQAMGRKGGPVNGVALAGLVLLLWRPEWYADLGWRLSVTAALLLAALAERGRGWKTALAACPLVWLATFPLSAGAFGAVAVSGLLVNFLALPVFTLLYPLAAGASLPALLGLPGGYYFAGAAEGLFIIWGWTADGLAAMAPWALSWSWGASFAGLSAFFIVVTLGLYPLGIRTLGAAALLASAAAVLLGPS